MSTQYCISGDSNLLDYLTHMGLIDAFSTFTNIYLENMNSKELGLQEIIRKVKINLKNLEEKDLSKFMDISIIMNLFYFSEMLKNNTEFCKLNFKEKLDN